jgi:arginyl-tRNA synthetase
MSNYIEKNIVKQLLLAFKALYDAQPAPDDLSLQPTRKEFPGTYTFVVFPFLKITRQKPEESGQQLGEYLRKHSDVVEAYNVVKGFLNIEVTSDAWLQILREMDTQPEFGHQSPNGQKVVVEFSSPNTNKPLHLGHLRNNFLGDAVSRILKESGSEVYRVNLVNDRGIHICKSMYAYQQMGQGETPETAGVKGDKLVGHYYVAFDKQYTQAFIFSHKETTSSSPASHFFSIS